MKLHDQRVVEYCTRKSGICLDSFTKFQRRLQVQGGCGSPCHKRLIAGGINLYHERVVSTGEHLMPSDNTASICLPRLESCCYSPSDDTIEDNHYYLPAAWNNPTFDAFVYWNRIGVGLQMTLGSNHSLKSMWTPIELYE